MELKTFIELHKDKNISKEGLTELYNYLIELNNKSLIELDIDFNNIDCYKENTKDYYFTLYGGIQANLINIYNGKALYFL